MLTKEECNQALGNLYFASYNPHRENELTQTLKENMHTLDNLIEEHFVLLKKYEILQDENGRLTFNNIINNIEDMNYKLWLDNLPLRFEELKKRMWVWDNLCKSYVKLYDTWESDGSYIKKGNYISFEPSVMAENYELFEENRFYRREVEQWQNAECLQKK